MYGTPDRSNGNEELLGKALQSFRNQIVIASKFGFGVAGTHVVIPDLQPSVIYSSVEGSLYRLRTDRIDLYYQHHIDPKVELEK